ncbi:M16 family metallopeptidase [Spartinivicinus poritis]|uniref:Pitrilysin family protein n=1 Tax=Spartinivicinus poritis TaxID=2994640 RepID=A0ABT5UAI3_9GAMM|nr:pitrilysin family protein [Spartinivicinus sp. A2-2]MDE1463375.1 pitrilysin family protein [Spartinivicinus sp. A2-2]
MNWHPLNTLMTAIWLSLLAAFSYAKPTITHEFQLENGLKLIVREDHRAPVVVSMVWYKVGGSYEPLGLTGVSHVLEHMMFKDTKKLKTGEFSRIMARIGAQDNAFTSKDATSYHQMLSAERLPVSFELEAERMQNLTIDDKEFSKEIKVVMEERRLRTTDKPTSLTYERFLATAHQTSPYKNPIVGWQRDLDAMTSEDIRYWYQQWYAPNNAIVVVVGDVKPIAVLDLARKYFGPIKPKQLPVIKPVYEHNTPGERRLTVSLPAQLPVLMMGFNVPVIKTTKQDWEPYALRLLAAVLDGGYSARIQKNIVRGKEIAAFANVSYNAFSRSDSLFMFSGSPNRQKQKGISDLETALWEEITSIQQVPPTTAELDRIVAQVISELVYQQDSIRAQANLIGGLTVIGLDWQLIDQDLDKLKAITPKQIQQVAKKYLVKDRLTVAELKPKGLHLK